MLTGGLCTGWGHDRGLIHAAIATLTSSWTGLWLLLCSPSSLGDTDGSWGSPSSEDLLFPLTGGAGKKKKQGEGKMENSEM